MYSGEYSEESRIIAARLLRQCVIEYLIDLRDSLCGIS